MKKESKTRPAINITVTKLQSIDETAEEEIAVKDTVKSESIMTPIFHNENAQSSSNTLSSNQV
jgi:hypothetical protein